MKYLSLFTGIGAFELAIRDIIENSSCVGFSEIDKHAIKIYEKNFPENEGLNLGDISRLVFDLDSKGNFLVNANRIKLLPDFDLLVGGAPCQDLSINKANREGLKGKKSRLFYAYLEILKVKKPKYFIFENVASMPKKDKETITKLFNDAGYVSKPVMIDSSLVSAQQRKRLYWTNWEVSQPEDMNINISRGGVPIHAWSKSCRPKNGFDERIRVNGKANSLTCSINGSESINFFPSELLNFQPRKVMKREQLFVNSISKDERLTINEAEELQTFPKDWTEGVSRNQRFKQLGNAITVNVLRHIIKKMN